MRFDSYPLEKYAQGMSGYFVERHSGFANRPWRVCLRTCDVDEAVRLYLSLRDNVRRGAVRVRLNWFSEQKLIAYHEPATGHKFYPPMACQ